jgi:DNA-binding GntR family transcriptional regulator
MMQGPRAAGLPKQTRTEAVRRRLEEEILGGVHPPGTHLDEKEQALRLGCSRTPLREAFNQLVATGLLVRRNHCGVHVAVHDRRRIVDLVQAFAAVEALCAEQAARRHGAEAGAGSPDGEDGADFTALTRAARQSCGNQVLADLAERLGVLAAPYRRLEGAAAAERDRAAAAALAAALAAGDGDGAARVVRDRLLAMAEAAAAHLPDRVSVAA